jgi:hypothetical protein
MDMDKDMILYTDTDKNTDKDMERTRTKKMTRTRTWVRIQGRDLHVADEPTLFVDLEDIGLMKPLFAFKTAAMKRHYRF